MDITSRLKNLKIDGKLRVYRLCMIALIGFLGVAAIILSFLMHAKVKEITEVCLRPSPVYRK